LLKRGRAVDPSIAAPGGGYGGAGGYGYTGAAATPYNSGGFVQPEPQQMYNPMAQQQTANIFTPEPLGGGSIGALPGQGKITL
jgi:hypothetical protein